MQRAYRAYDATMKKKKQRTHIAQMKWTTEKKDKSNLK